MVPGLDPNDLLKKAFERMALHWQNHSDQDPKLRQRNRRCFFFPS
jgi:hypothetical protein